MSAIHKVQASIPRTLIKKTCWGVHGILRNHLSFTFLANAEGSEGVKTSTTKKTNFIAEKKNNGLFFNMLNSVSVNQDLCGLTALSDSF